MKKFLLFLLMLFILTACSQQEESADKAELEKQEGVVALKREKDNGTASDQLLLIPGITKEEVMNRSESEIYDIALENNGAFYGVSPEEYNEIDRGTKIVVYWNGYQEDSGIPQRTAEIIEKAGN